MSVFRSLLYLLTPWVSVMVLAAQDVPAAQGDVAPAEASTLQSAKSGSILTRKDARAITLKIPAPRGLIVDRHGEVIAQNRVVYQVALQFEQFEDVDRDFVVAWGRARLNALEALVENLFPKTDEDLFQHYRHRRWLPLYLTSEFTAEEAKELQPKLPKGLVMAPIYSRFYPHGQLASHIIGYTGIEGQVPTGPINFNDPLWSDTVGRSGLEKLYNDKLTGVAGMKKLIFDEKGNKLLEHIDKQPRPGGTLVTTLDLKWQQIAEKTLDEGCERGAFVVIDVVSGEVLVMASRPSFDLNAFIPRISSEDFNALRDDPSNPLYGRAFQSAYPPASSFKPIVALAALNDRLVTTETLVNCPVAIQVGNKEFKNWSPDPEGEINVMRAIARSCNTWFYQVGIAVGPRSFLGIAKNLGFGQKTGLPLIGETPGILPDDEWMMKNEGRPILDGDTANLSIGQGSLLSSPLQVCQAMAGIGNGQVLPKLSLIHQVQDKRGRVTEISAPEERNQLNLDPYAVLVTRQGMSDVVNAGGGTGLGAQLSYTQLCGKTGTAQWGPESKNQRLAWFAGFLPKDNPRYAFAVLYEGKPGERVSGGRLAAPMVRKFFEEVKDDVMGSTKAPQKALVVFDDGADGDIPTARVVPEDEVPTDGVITNDGGDRPLRALPVLPLNGIGPSFLRTPDGVTVPPLDGESILRAVPVVEEPPAAIPVEVPPAAIPVEEGAPSAIPVDEEGVPPPAIPVGEP